METVDEYGVLNPHAAANIPMQGSVNVSVLHMFQKLASTYLCIISVDEDSVIRKKMAENWHSRDEDQTHQRLDLISFLQQKTQAGETGFQKTKKKKNSLKIFQNSFKFLSFWIRLADPGVLLKKPCLWCLSKVKWLMLQGPCSSMGETTVCLWITEWWKIWWSAFLDLWMVSAL